ncbi:TPA: glucuronide uptake porin UidC [Escherichia coli]|nr:glucuronide uptake porin UidC [Escherichia coli]
MNKRYLIIFLAVLPLMVSAKKNEDTLRFRLKNEMRRASKPSAGAAKDIYAWVQGGMIDFSSKYYRDMFSIEFGGYYVYKLGARYSMSTRAYLDGHDSFGFMSAALKIKPTDNIYIKLGRFSTDSDYGSLPYAVPLIDIASNRTLPGMSEGVLFYYNYDNSLDIWGLWRNGVFTSYDSEYGVRNDGIDSGCPGKKYDIHRPLNMLALSWHNTSGRYSLGGSYQKDDSVQILGELNKKFKIRERDSVKSQLKFFYAELEGFNKEKKRRAGEPDDTYLLSGQISFNTPDIGAFVSAGYINHAISGTNVDTDRSYVYSLSIDRNKEQMYSFQTGFTYNITPELSVMFAPMMTHGYESSRKDVEIQGACILGAMNYNINNGPNIFLSADRCREKRDGSRFGDRLNYWDVKLSIRYDIYI